MPDGSPDLGFMVLTGRTALYARPGIEAQLDKLLSDSRDSLTTLDQQLEYDTISRKFRAQWTAEIGSHADSSAKDYYTQVNAATSRQAVQSIGNNLDPTPEAHGARKHDFADLIRSFQMDAVQNHGAKTLADGVTPDPNDPLVKDATARAKQIGMQTWVDGFARAPLDIRMQSARRRDQDRIRDTLGEARANRVFPEGGTSQTRAYLT
jgi:hypothetical protein